jgi:copper chaperone CopZ
MKILSLISLILFTFTVHADHDEHKHMLHDHGNAIQTPVLSAGEFDPEGELITVHAFGLVCDFCAQAIEKVFMRKDEVSGINVNLAESRITISTKKGKPLDDEIVTKLITDAGYNVEKISRQTSGSSE